MLVCVVLCCVLLSVVFCSVLCFAQCCVCAVLCCAVLCGEVMCCALLWLCCAVLCCCIIRCCCVALRRAVLFYVMSGVVTKNIYIYIYTTHVPPKRGHNLFQAVTALVCITWPTLISIKKVGTPARIRHRIYGIRNAPNRAWEKNKHAMHACGGSVAQALDRPPALWGHVISISLK